MKLREVPKDDANVMEGKTSFIQYAVDDEGNYVQEKSPGFQPQNVALEQAWDEVNERRTEALNMVIEGSKSPIFFFMHREIMDEKILSEYVGMAKWRVKRHMKPSVFKKLKQEQILKYLELFKLDNEDDLMKFNAEKWK